MCRQWRYRATGIACALLLGCSSEPPPLAEAPQEPGDRKVVELARYIDLLTGPDAVECGVHPFERVNGTLVRASEADLLRSRDCGLRAVAAGKPFWTYAQYPGVESWGASGLIGARDGQVYVMDFDGAPGGDPAEPGRFSFSRCHPPIHVAEPPWLRYQCVGRPF